MFASPATDRRWPAWSVAMLATTALVLSLLSGTTLSGAASAQEAPARTSGDTATPSSAQRGTVPTEAEREEEALDVSTDRKGWLPSTGPEFNSPVGSRASKYRLMNKVMRAVRNAHPGSKIFIMSWNVQSQSAVDELLAAQRRGVVLRVLMDKYNIAQRPENKAWPKLVSGFRQWNRAHPKRQASLAKTCTFSCRGKRGSAHGKYFLFTHTGAAHWVVMHGGFNLTKAASVNQWNDLYTWRGNKELFTWTRGIFDEMWRDKPVQKQFKRYWWNGGKTGMWFMPFAGPLYKGDPALRYLRKVRCHNAHNTSHGRTKIRVAPDVIRHARGMRYAREFIRMHRQGCDVKIGYTVLGIDIRRELKAAGVPIKHLVQDANGDKDFDRYFHLKVVTVNGRVGDNGRSYGIINGSANMSAVAADSDEQMSLLRGYRGQTMRYQEHIDYWYNNYPASARVQARYRGVPVDPYQHVDMD